MSWLVSTISFILVCYSYIAVSRKDRTFINFLTPWALIFIPANYLLQWMFMAFFGPGFSDFAYLVCYASYALMFVVSALVYCKAGPLRITFRETAFNIGMKPWFLLIAAWLLYLPVLVEFREFLLAPREIYTRTRTGYGLMFFGSAFLVDLAFILYLFKQDKSKLWSLTFGGLCVALTFLHGAKSHLVFYVLVWLMYAVYVERRRFAILKTIWFSLVFAVILLSAFFAFASQASLQEFAMSVIEYSDYTRNAMTVIDDPAGYRYYGRLTLENAFYSRIPRFLDPDKPKEFGEFRLAEKYMPEQFELDSGSPAFGIGVQYADFGMFAIVYLSLVAALNAILAKSFAPGARNPANFIMFLFATGLSLIPSGDFYLLPEHVILALLVAILIRYRFSFASIPQAGAARAR